MKLRPKKLNQAGFDHVSILLMFVVIFGLIGAYFLFKSFAATPPPTPELESTLGINICVAGGTSAGGTTHLGTCDGSAGEQWKAANGVIENATSGTCLEPSTLPTTGNPVISVVSEKCNPSDAKQKWTGSGNPTELKNTAASSTKDTSLKNGDCLVYPNNDAAVNVNASLAIEMVGCSTARPADQVWNTSAMHVAATGGSGTKKTVADCSGTVNQMLLCRAEQWGGTPYVWGGGPHGPSTYTAFKSKCEKSGVAITTSACGMDCSGFISTVVDDVLGTNYGWTVGDQAMSGGNWKKIATSSNTAGAEPGDIMTSNGHVEFVLSRSSSGVITTYGEHHTGTVVNAAGYPPTPFTIWRWN